VTLQALSANDHVLIGVCAAGVEDAWPTIEKGLKRVLEWSCGMATPEGIKGNCLCGRYQILTMYAGGDYKGFVIWEANFSGEHLWVDMLYVWAQPGAMDVFLPSIERYFFSELGAHGTRFLSSRIGWAKRAAHFGYSPRFIEYVKEREE
jgi:hypothetical protein